MRPFTKLNPPTDPAATEDAFTEFAPEPAAPVDVQEERDWFAEFPEEQPAKTVPSRPAIATRSTRSTTWLSLSESLKDEKA